jgi:hypothetical protein
VRTEFMNMTGMAASSLAGRGVAGVRGASQSRQASEAQFQRTLSSISDADSPAESVNTADPATTSSNWRDTHTRAIIDSSSQGSGRSATAQSGGLATKLFGPDQNQNVGLDEDAEWVDYFKTHAPGEWWDNQRTRAKFAETYSDAALVTLDWTGTVPENIDPVFVTKCAVDASGKPFPKVSSTELT